MVQTPPIRILQTGINEGDVLAGDPTSDSIKNKVFVKRWELQKQSKVIELYGRLHADICNVSQFLLSD